MKTPHCGVYCRIVNGQMYHYHSGRKRKHHRHRGGPLFRDRQDTIGPHAHWDKTDRGAVRAAERAHAYSPHE